MIKQLNDKTRIKLKFHLPALAVVFCLQRKKWHGWITVSWIYPSVTEDNSFEYIIQWLEWKEKYKLKSEKEIGKELITNSLYQTFNMDYTHDI